MGLNIWFAWYTPVVYCATYVLASLLMGHTSGIIAVPFTVFFFWLFGWLKPFDRGRFHD